LLTLLVSMTGAPASVAAAAPASLAALTGARAVLPGANPAAVTGPACDHGYHAVEATLRHDASRSGALS
jgi:hypothetical protein